MEHLGVNNIHIYFDFKMWKKAFVFLFTIFRYQLLLDLVKAFWKMDNGISLFATM